MGAGHGKLKEMTVGKKLKKKHVKRLFKRYTKSKHNPMKYSKFLNMMHDLKLHLDYQFELDE